MIPFLLHWKNSPAAPNTIHNSTYSPRFIIQVVCKLLHVELTATGTPAIALVSCLVPLGSDGVLLGFRVGGSTAKEAADRNADRGAGGYTALLGNGYSVGEGSKLLK